jgi:hypothetical protein
MGNNIRSWAIPAVIAMADLLVFVYFIPILCEAWGANRYFMACLFVLMIVWIESLVNILRATVQAWRRDQSAVLISSESSELRGRGLGDKINV